MDDDAAELREEVEQLKQTVAKQQETIEELENQSLLGSWGRRGVLGGIAAALGLASASGSAAAGVGDIGTPSERVDVFADTLEVGSLDSSISDFSNKSKSAGTEYQNTAGHLIEVSIQITQTTGSPANISSSIRVGTSSGLTGVDTEELTQIEIGDGDVVTTTAIVPDQSYYILELFADGKVDTWREREWSN